MLTPTRGFTLNGLSTSPFANGCFPVTYAYKHDGLGLGATRRGTLFLGIRRMHGNTGNAHPSGTDTRTTDKRLCLAFESERYLELVHRQASLRYREDAVLRHFDVLRHAIQHRKICQSRVGEADGAVIGPASDRFRM